MFVCAHVCVICFFTFLELHSYSLHSITQSDKSKKRTRRLQRYERPWRALFLEKEKGQVKNQDLDLGLDCLTRPVVTSIGVSECLFHWKNPLSPAVRTASSVPFLGKKHGRCPPFFPQRPTHWIPKATILAINLRVGIHINRRSKVRFSRGGGRSGRSRRSWEGEPQRKATVRESPTRLGEGQLQDL